MTRVLVVEGGGLRGAFVAGALSELAAAGETFDHIVAVSSGAPTAAYFAAGQVERAIEIWRDHVHGTQLVAFANPLRGRPIMDIDRLVGVFEHVVRLDPAAVARSATRLWCGITDARSGEARYLVATEDNVFDLLRATMALPIAYGKVCRVDGHAAIDGGVAAPIAIAHARTLAPSQLVVILTRPASYRRSEATWRDRLVGWSYPRHPGIRRAMAGHTQRANATAVLLDDLVARGEARVIRPAVELPASRLSRDRATIHATIDAGRAAVARGR